MKMEASVAESYNKIVGSAYKLLYKTGFFDVIVSALVVDHLANLDKAFS